MTDDRIKLTRRKILAAGGAVGAAGVGAGLGTSALFSDEESFEGNIVAAGELNMQVAAHVRDQNDAMPQVEIDSDATPQDTADGNTVTIIARDVKPGDWFIIQWDVFVCANPGYVQVTSVDADYENREGDNPESETDTAPPGDLGDALLTTIWPHIVPTGNNGPSALEGGLDETTDLNDSGLFSYETPDLDGNTPGGAHYTTINEAHDVYKTGVTIRDPSTGDPLVVGCDVRVDAATYYQLFELPAGVGNDVQGDVVEFTLRFDAEQARNNDDPFGS